MYAEIQIHPPAPDQSRYIRPIERKGGEMAWRVYLKFDESYDYSRFLGWWLKNVKSGDVYNFTDRFNVNDTDHDRELFFSGLIRDKDEAEQFEIEWAILSKLCEDISDEEEV